MTSQSFFEAHITTHQHGSAGIDYRAVHRQMAAQGFERVIQSTAQAANEVPGTYRLYNAQLSMAQVVEMLRLTLAPLGRGMAVQIMKIDEETLLNLIPPAPSTQDTEPASDHPHSSGRAQSGYPTWRRPR